MKLLIKVAVIPGAGGGIGQAVAPAVVDTPVRDRVDSLLACYKNFAPVESKRQVGAVVPVGGVEVSENFAGVAVFLASEGSNYVTPRH